MEKHQLGWHVVLLQREWLFSGTNSCKQGRSEAARESGSHNKHDEKDVGKGLNGRAKQLVAELLAADCKRGVWWEEQWRNSSRKKLKLPLPFSNTPCQQDQDASAANPH